MADREQKPFNVANWYWFVAGDHTKAFSSASGDYVPITDATFVTWSADGSKPTEIATEISLGAVLSNALIRPVNASVLDAYQGAQAADIVARTIFKVLFNHENRLRACERALGLNGNPPNITPAQAINAVKALM